MSETDNGGEKAALACAGLAAVAAAAILHGGQGAERAFVQALGLAVCAGGLGLTALRWTRGGIVLGALATALGGINLLSYALSRAPGAGAGLAPHTALAVATFGVALLMAAPGRYERLRSVGVGALGGAVAVLCLATLGAHAVGLEGAYGWGVLARMPVAVALGLLVLGLGVVGLVWRANATDRSRYGVAISVSIASGLCASVALAATLLNAEGHTQRRLARSEIQRLSYALNVVTEVHTVAIERMAARWNQEEGTPFWRWRADAENHLAEVSAFVALAWIDADGTTQWARGEDAPLSLEAEQARQLLELAQPSASARLFGDTPRPGQLTAAIRLGDGGALVAILSLDALLELAWGETAADHHVELASRSRTLFANQGERESGGARGEEIPFALRGLDWQLRVAPADAAAVGAGPAMTFIAGIFLTLLASFAMALRRTALERAEALEIVSSELEASAQQLMTTNAELLRSNEELGRFATLASHDLQEPLRQITSFSERLAQKHTASLDDNGRTYLGFITEAATRARHLIEDLLQYARVDGQAQRMEAVDCNEALATAIENLQDRIDGAGAQISSDPMPQLRGNPVLLTQLFQNLLGNALKYRGEHAPRVHVGVRDTESGFQFEVRDNGIGIDPAYHTKIFQIFERVPMDPDEHEASGAGTGVGLAICKKVVERLGGEISVESAPGEGSSFRFWIPKTKEFPQPERG